MIKIYKIRLNLVFPLMQVNLTNEKFIALTNEINIIGEPDGWWLDIGSLHHAC